MMVFELFYPGARIELEDRNLAFELQNYLSAIESRFNDAAVVLSLFEEAQARHLTDMENRIHGPSSFQEPESDELGQAQFEPGMDGRTFLLHFLNQQLEAKRRRWEAGERPRAYTSRLPFVYARSFLFSLWDVRKLLGQIARCPGISDEAGSIAKAFDAAFATLKGLRDSSAHINERVARQAHGRPIAPKPLDNVLVKAPSGGVLVVESLVNNRFVGTTSDGELAEVEVSADTMAKVQECVQRLLNSLPWSGMSRHCPE